MTRRTVKQLIYGSLYLAIIFGIVYIVYLGVKPAPTCFDGKKNQGEEDIDCGGPCPPCELKTVKPIRVSPVEIFSLDGIISALAVLTNPNTNLAADKFLYEFNFYDTAGEKIFTLSKDSFIYPGEIKYIAEANLNVDYGKIGRRELLITGENWKLASEFPMPKFSTREVKTEFDAIKNQVVVTGVLVNENLYGLSRAGVGAIISNSLGIEIAVSKTLLTDIEPREERSFRIVFPAKEKPDFDPRETKVFVEVKR